MIFQCSEHANKLLSFNEQHEFFDIVLIAGTNRVKIQAHRFVLGAFSDYFLAMFRSNLREATANEIELREVDAVTLKLIIDFMYTATIEIHSDTVENLLRAADFFQISTLIAVCCDFIGDQLDASNCLGIALFAEQYNYSSLHRKSSTFAYTHFKKVSTKKEFFHLSEQQFIKLLSSDDLCAFETVVFKSLVAWIEYDRENRQKLAITLLSHIRFTFLTPTFIIENQRTVFTTVECYELIRSWLQWHLSPENRSLLPPELTTARRGNKKLVVVNKSFESDLKVQTYNPELNSWSNTALPTPSEARKRYGATAINKKFIIAGGHINGAPTNSVKCLDFETVEWTDLPSMRLARELPAMAELNGYLYVIGGHINGYWSSSVERYTFSTREWEDVASLHSAFECIQVVAHGDMLYAAGDGGTTMECYDPLTNRWTQKSFKNDKSESFGFSGVGEHLYTVGVNHNGKQNKMVERYDPSTDIWTVVSSFKTARDTVMCATLNQKLVACGGYVHGRLSNKIEEYNPETDEWKTLAPMPLKVFPMSAFAM